MQTLLEKQILLAAKEDPKSLPKGLKELKAETAREIIDMFFDLYGDYNCKRWVSEVEKKYPQVKP